MDFDLIGVVTGGFIDAMINAVQIFTPVAQGLFGALTAIAVLLFAFCWLNGVSAAVPETIRVCFLAGFSAWLIGNWVPFTLMLLEDARTAISWVIPGYTGPGSILTAGADIASRLIAQDIQLANPITMIIDGFFIGIGSWLIFLSFLVISLTAALAEMQLLLFASVGIFVLPFICVGALSSIGLGTLRAMLVSFLKTIGMGILTSAMMDGILNVLEVPGTNGVLSSREIMVIAGLGLTAAVFAVSASAAFNSAVGHIGGSGGMGHGSIQHATSVTTGGAGSAARIASGAASGAGRGSSGAGGGLSGAFAKHGQAMGRAAGKIVRSSGTGSPFGGK